MTDEQTQMLLQAALDGELDASAMLSFHHCLAGEPDLAAEYGRQRALRQAIQRLPKTQASEAFRARMAAIGVPAAAAPEIDPPRVSLLHQTRTWLGDWRPTALAASLALILGSGLTFLALPSRQGDVAERLVADHIRGMIAGQPADVASTDRHTVKPWFATRIIQAPHVVDLAADGFPLIGGRVDVIDDKPVATLVFQHAKHIISVSELPSALAPAKPGQVHSTVKGYSVLTWGGGAAGPTYIAVSDIAPTDLDALAAAFRKAVAEN